MFIRIRKWPEAKRTIRGEREKERKKRRPFRSRCYPYKKNLFLYSCYSNHHDMEKADMFTETLIVNLLVTVDWGFFGIFLNPKGYLYCSRVHDLKTTSRKKRIQENLSCSWCQAKSKRLKKQTCSPMYSLVTKNSNSPFLTLVSSLNSGFVRLVCGKMKHVAKHIVYRFCFAMAISAYNILILICLVTFEDLMSYSWRFPDANWPTFSWTISSVVHRFRFSYKNRY